MNRKKIILIEDDQKKVADIKSFLSSINMEYELIVSESYQSGLRELFKNGYDLLLLDMSIPTWDKVPNKSSGEFQKFGGYTILQELNRKNKLLPTILISMFDEFGESDRSITLQQLDKILAKEFEEYYEGAIYYSSSQNDWKNQLKDKLSSHF